MMKGTILYIYPEYSSFIQKDINFLSRRYNVLTPGHDWKVKRKTPLNFLKQLFFLFRHMRKAKAVFVMFGGYWSFLPALMGRVTARPVYIIPGGTDCVSFPSLRYGSLRKPLMRTFIKWSFQLCRELLPVDGSLVLTDYSYYEGSDHQKQGYKYFFPKIKTPYRVIYNGFDPDFFSCDQACKEADSFIVVAAVNSTMRVRIKGIDLVLYLAEQYSHYSFTVIGVTDNIVSRIGPVPANVKIHPYLPQEQFRTFLARSQFVLQLSVSEGFPNALCEAMLCNCVPVGSSVGAIPYIIGDAGYIVTNSDKDYLKGRFDEITCTDNVTRLEMGSRARKRIAENFHISRREKAFFELLEEIR